MVDSRSGEPAAQPTAGGVEGVIREGGTSVSGAGLVVQAASPGITVSEVSYVTDTTGYYKIPNLDLGRYNLIVTIASTGQTVTLPFVVDELGVYERLDADL